MTLDVVTAELRPPNACAESDYGDAEQRRQNDKNASASVEFFDAVRGGVNTARDPIGGVSSSAKICRGVTQALR